MARRSIAVLAARLRLVVAAGAACVALAGCFASAPPRPDARAMAAYPQVVAGFGRYDRFPRVVAGFQRGAVRTYAPGLVEYAIDYGRDDAALQAAVTLRFFPRIDDVAAQLRDEEQQVLQMHRAVRVVSHDTITLVRNGAPFEAHVVHFEYDDRVGGVVQPVAAEQLVVFRAQGVFEARSVAPLAQARAADAALLQLLEGVAWDAPEAFGE